MHQIRLNTPVPLEHLGFSISHSDHIMLMGSCFAENMGKRMQNLRFDVNVNPFGILYNPLSMAEALSRCLDNSEMGEESLVQYEGLWHSWLHHGSFSSVDKVECLNACNDAIHAANNFLKSCSVVILTFGSAWYYELSASGKVVANCHKLPAANFTKRIATVDEVVSMWKPLVERLKQSGIKVVYTVSPVRHQAYGAHGNQLGKAVLLLAIEHLVAEVGGVYFPAYEILVDELRDYRFYADDMAHPSPVAEQIIWQRFQDATMTQETILRCDEIEKENKRSAHRPIHKEII